MADAGARGARPGFRRSRRVFLRGLGLVYALAFGALWVQLEGLVGAGGIAPAAQTLARWDGWLAGDELARWTQFPTLLWLGGGGAALHALCGLGMAAAAALVLGRLPAFAALVAWACYLSLVVVAEPFTAFQWDTLLLETGLLAVVVAPWTARSRAATDAEPPRAARWLLWLLVFRLMFLSGLVKLTSGDPTWADGTALLHHFATQPLPTPLAWHAHQLPAGVLRAACWGMFAVELGVPFLAFAPRRLRRLAVPPLVLLQVVIALTGNYGFFNVLTAVLCLTLLDDGWLGGAGRGAPEPAPRCGRVQALAASVALLVLGPLGALHVVRAVGHGLDRADLAGLGTPALRAAAPLRAVNSYGLFRVMTTERAEVVVEGSADGVEWEAYRFRYKPGRLDRTPGWVAPHMPRLDWQMWFLPFPWLAGASWQRHSPWFRGLLQSLLEGSDDVRGLLAHDPFPEVPPRFVRARVSRYSFTDAAAREETGAVWLRTPYPDPELVPPISLNPARGGPKRVPGGR